MGNSERVAENRYLQVTDADFAAALQNPVQQRTAIACTETHQEVSADENSGNDQQFSVFGDTEVSPAGFEPTTYGLKVRCSTN
jgi:hypothetical protein